MIYTQFFTGLVVTLLLDSIWIGVITKSLYQKMIGHVMADKPNFIAAAIFYPLFVTAIIVFIITPALKGDWSLWRVALMGGFFGLALYGTYDLTSNAIIKNWPISITIIDMVWGVVITGTVSIAIIVVSRLF